MPLTILTFYCSEHLKAVPDLLETLMSEKRLLQASVLLVRSLKIINKSEMLEIGAVADLRSYLNGQETVSLGHIKLSTATPTVLYRHYERSWSMSFTATCISNLFGANPVGRHTPPTNKRVSTRHFYFAVFIRIYF